VEKELQSKEAPAPASEEPTKVEAPEATVTQLEPRSKSAGKPTVRQNLKGPKITRGTRITKPTFGNVTSTFY
jgi:hypothetical protein